MPNYSYDNTPWYSQRKKIKKVVIKDGVTSIGDYAFEYCSSLTSITIPNSVMSIGEYAFRGCSGLTSLTIPNSVTSIGDFAFYKCSGLTSVTIPNSVTSIEGGAFYGTKWYDNQPDGVVYAGKVLYAYKGTMPSNTKIEIKEGTTQIAYDAFRDCSGLTSVTIPNSVTSIGSSAFYGCSGLTSLTIPNSVTSIGNYIFDGCKTLTSLTIPNSVTSIGIYTFDNCLGLTSVTIPNSVTSIGGFAFNNCKALTSITIPNSVTSIGSYAFQGCSGLTSLTIPESVTSIGGSAFYGAKLRNIVIKAKTPPSGGSAFSNQSYYHTTLMVPEGSWDAYAYSDNWYQFIHIREVAYNAVNLTNSKAYMLKSSNEGSYLFYDSVNDCVASLNETALDDTEENNTWMTTEVDGKHYVYNLGAKKFLVADKTNAKTGYRLSDVPASIDIEDGKDAIVFGKSKEFYMVVNDKLNVDEGLESQIMTSTGINEIDVESNLPIVTYNLNGQRINNSNAQKGVFIKNGKKYTK